MRKQDDILCEIFMLFSKHIGQQILSQGVCIYRKERNKHENSIIGTQQLDKVFPFNK